MTFAKSSMKSGVAASFNRTMSKNKNHDSGRSPNFNLVGGQSQAQSKIIQSKVN
jgi:hypothetical protein